MRYVSIAKDTYLGTRQCCFLRKNGIDYFYFLIKTAKHFSQVMQAMCGQASIEPIQFGRVVDPPKAQHARHAGQYV